jgi:putative membrane protein
VNDLTPLRGAEFDEKYMRMMVKDHNEDIELFEKAAKSHDPDISAFANKTLPVLGKHFVAAKKISEGLKK